MAQVRLLGLVEVPQQAPQGKKRGAVGLGQAVRLVLPELPLHLLRRRLQAEAGFPAVLGQAVEFLPQEVDKARLLERAVIEDRLHRGEAAQLVFHMAEPLGPGEGGGVGLAGGDVAEGEARAFIVHADGADVVGPPPLQHGGVHGAGGDDADDVPLHQALGGGGVLGLLADGHLVALGDEPGDVPVAGVVGHAAHGGALVLRLGPVPGGEGQVQLPACEEGVVAEHLVEVPQAEKEDGVLVLFLDLVVLLHHGGHVGHVRSSFSIYVGGAPCTLIHPG